MGQVIGDACFDCRCPCCTQDLSPWAFCHRTALRKAVQALMDEFGLSLLVGYETEFILLDKESM
jgi:glutamine synthetase